MSKAKVMSNGRSHAERHPGVVQSFMSTRRAWSLAWTSSALVRVFARSLGLVEEPLRRGVHRWSVMCAPCQDVSTLPFDYAEVLGTRRTLYSNTAQDGVPGVRTGANECDGWFITGPRCRGCECRGPAKHHGQREGIT
jgi:hypothetical protein